MSSTPLPRYPVLWVLAVAVGLAAIRLLGPCDLSDDYHQERAGAYVLDVLQHNHWIAQYGIRGEISTKPPLYTWLAALAHLPFPRANWTALVLPATLTTCLIAVLLWHAGRRWIHPLSGWLAALAFLLSPLGAKQMGLARIDGVFACTVFVTALLAFRAWSNGKGWTWFWIAGAVATLAKGPLGPALAGAGLLAVLWEKRSGTPHPIRGTQWPGFLLFLILAGGWFLLALRQAGPVLAQTLLGNELTKHAIGGRDNQIPLIGFYEPTFYIVTRFLPWSPLVLLGLRRVWKQPAASDAERRFERFLFCYFTLGLLVLSLAAHQRDDLIFPLIPPAALLAGREIARWLGQHEPLRARRLVAAACALGLLLAAGQYDVLQQQNRLVERTRRVRGLAQFIEARLGYQYPVHHVDSPASLQFFLNTKRPLVPFEQAVSLLQSNAPAYVLLTNTTGLYAQLGSGTNRLHELQRIPLGKGRDLSLVANAPLPDPMPPGK